VFKKAVLLSLSWARWMPPVAFHSVSYRQILIRSLVCTYVFRNYRQITSDAAIRTSEQTFCTLIIQNTIGLYPNETGCFPWHRYAHRATLSISTAMDESFSLVDDGQSADQEVLHFLWNKNIQYHVHKFPLLVARINRINLVLSLPSILFN
jgi:hypothetical protein